MKMYNPWNKHAVRDPGAATYGNEITLDLDRRSIVVIHSMK